MEYDRAQWIIPVYADNKSLAERWEPSWWCLWVVIEWTMLKIMLLDWNPTSTSLEWCSSWMKLRIQWLLKRREIAFPRHERTRWIKFHISDTNSPDVVFNEKERE